MGRNGKGRVNRGQGEAWRERWKVESKNSGAGIDTGMGQERRSHGERTVRGTKVCPVTTGVSYLVGLAFLGTPEARN